MRIQWLASVVSMVALAGPAWAQGSGASAQPRNDEEKTLYGVGYQFGKSIAILGMSPSELEVLKKGIADATAGAPPAVELDASGAKTQALARARQGQANERALQKAAREKGAQTLARGIIYQEVKAGAGASPKATDTVSVHYRGTLLTGEEFDSSYKRGQTVEFPLNGVIPCWTEGVQKMKTGGKAKLLCPPATAYGDRPPPGSRIPPGAALRFEVELVAIPGGR